MAKQRWTADLIPDQSGRIAVVTGGNSGIGYAAARALANAGAEVIIASRSQQRGEYAVASIRAKGIGGPVRFLSLDLASLRSVRQFVAAFQGRYDRLDLLINNAGVMMPRSRQETADGFELQFGTNHLGHFALTLGLSEHLTRTAGSRVVTVSSSAQNFGKFDLDDLNWQRRRFRRMPSYGASKIANMLFSLELQRRFVAADAPTIAVACHPGWTNTNLQKTSPLFRMLSPLLGMPPAQGALPTLFSAVAEQVVAGGYYGPDGLGTMRGYPVANKPAAVSCDAEAAQRLWQLSTEMLDGAVEDS